MLEITPAFYRALAGRLLDETRDLPLFNGSVELDTEEYHARLTCTLILPRDETTRELLSVLPVWWEFHLHQPQGETDTDFGWSELERYLQQAVRPV